MRKRFMGILNGGNKEIGENPLLQLGALVEDMSRQIAANGVFAEYSNPDPSKSLFPAPPKDGRECSTDPFLESYPVPENNPSKPIRGGMIGDSSFMLWNMSSADLKPQIVSRNKGCFESCDQLLCVVFDEQEPSKKGLVIHQYPFLF